jgi:uncharacterized membrane protein YbhN (UPF0104 family)
VGNTSLLSNLKWITVGIKATKDRFLKLVPLLGPVLFTLALWVLHRELQAYHWQDITAQFGRIPRKSFWAALILTLASYAIMTCYDLLGLRFIQRSLSYGKIALASFISYALSNNIGLSMIAGASVRYRLYSAWGLSGLEITKLVFFCAISLWLGFLLLGGVVFTFAGTALPHQMHLPFSSIRPLGIFFLALVGGYLVVNLRWKRPIQIGTWELTSPPFPMLLFQLFVASVDWGLAGGVLYVLLPATPALSFPV